MQAAAADQLEDKEVEMTNILAGMLVLSLPEGDDKLSNFLVPVSTGARDR